MKADDRILAEGITRFYHAFAMVEPGCGSWRVASRVSKPRAWSRLTTFEIPNPSRGKRTPLWEPLSQESMEQRGDRLIPPVRDYFCRANSDSSRVASFRLGDQAIDWIGRDLVIPVAAGGQTTDLGFSIVAVELYLFDTGIGLLAFELSPGEIREHHPAPDGNTTTTTSTTKRSYTLNDLVELNNKLHTLETGAPTIFSHRWRKRQAHANGDPTRPDDDAGVLWDLYTGGEFRIAELMGTLLEPLSACGVECRAIALPYLRGVAFARVEATADSYRPLAKSFFRLRRFYNSRYDPAPVQTEATGNPEIQQTFERIYLGACSEGMAVLVLDDTETPFYRQMADRVRKGYAMAFLLTLHQRFALELLSLQAGELPRIEPDGGGTLDSAIDQVRHVRIAVFNFTLHHTFPVVSSTTMYQQVYEQLTEAMGVGNVHDSLRNEIQEMDDLLQRAREREAESSRDRLEVILAFLAVLGFVTGFWGANFIEMVGPDSAEHGILSAPSLLSFGAATLILVGWFLVTRRVLQRRKPGRGAST